MLLFLSSLPLILYVTIIKAFYAIPYVSATYRCHTMGTFKKALCDMKHVRELKNVHGFCFLSTIKKLLWGFNEHHLSSKNKYLYPWILDLSKSTLLVKWESRVNSLIWKLYWWSNVFSSSMNHMFEKYFFPTYM